MSARARNPEFTGLRNDAAEIIGKICRIHGQVGVFIHHYDGSIIDEVIKIRREREMSLSEFEVASPNLPEDEIWWVEAD